MAKNNTFQYTILFLIIFAIFLALYNKDSLIYKKSNLKITSSYDSAQSLTKQMPSPYRINKINTYKGGSNKKIRTKKVVFNAVRKERLYDIQSGKILEDKLGKT